MFFIKQVVGKINHFTTHKKKHKKNSNIASKQEYENPTQTKSDTKNKKIKYY
jgi:hypothetical protein